MSVSLSPLAVSVEMLVNEPKPSRHHRSAKAQRQRRREHEPIAPRKRHRRNNPDTRRDDRGKQESRHAAQHSRRDRDERRGELRENPHDQQPEAGGVAGLAVGAARERDHAVVLREDGHGRDGAEAGDEAADAVGQHAALDTGVEEGAVDLEARDVAGGGNVADAVSGMLVWWAV